MISIVVSARSHKNIPLIDTTTTLITEEDDTSKNQETNKMTI